MHKRSVLVALCWCLGGGFLLWSQSVYQDALRLAQILEQSKQERAQDALWFRLSHTTPVVRAAKSLEHTPQFAIEAAAATDYLLFNQGQHPDALVVYRASAPEDTLFASPIKYDFCLVRLREGDAVDTLAVVAPSGETVAAYTEAGLANTDLVLANLLPGNFLFYAPPNSLSRQGNPLTLERLDAHPRPLEKREWLVFPTLGLADTLVLKRAGQPLLYVYHNGPMPLQRVLQFADSVRTQVDGEIFAAAYDTLEVGSEPFMLVKVESPTNGQSPWVGLMAPQKPFYWLEMGQHDDLDYTLEILSPLKRIGAETADKTLDLDSIPLGDLNGGIALSGNCSGGLDQMSLYSGERHLGNVNLSPYKILERAAVNPTSNTMDLTLIHVIRPNDVQYRHFRKKYTRVNNFPLRFVLIRRTFDYHCPYVQGTPEAVDPNKFIFQAREIGEDRDTIYPITLGQLGDLRLQEDMLYVLTLDTAVLKRQWGLGALDFSDIAFQLLFEKNEDPFFWYPVLNPNLEVFVKDGQVNIFYAPAQISETLSVPLVQDDSLAVLLGSHARIKPTELESAYLWGDISEQYRKNPFLATSLKHQLARTRFDALPGNSNPVLSGAISHRMDAYFPWQKIVFGADRPPAAQQVAYDELVNTYRTRIATASDKLQEASEQFNSETQRLRRGLSTAELAAGLSDFVVERAQEELNLTFLNRLRDRVQQDSEFMVLFPQTVKVMGDFEVSQYRTLLDFSKTAFLQDLRNLGVSFPRLFSQVYQYRALENDPTVYNLFLLYDIANQIYAGNPVENVLLHLNARLKERRTALEESLNRELGRSLARDATKQQALSELIHRQGVIMAQAHENAYQLGEHFLRKWQAFSRTMRQEGATSEAMAQIETLKEGLEDVLRLEVDVRRNALRIGRVPRNFEQYDFAGRNLLGDPGYEYLQTQLAFNRFHEFFNQNPDTGRTISLGLAQANALLAETDVRRMEATLQAMEARVTTMQTLQQNLERHRAKTDISLANYLPLLKKYKALTAKRVCLELALDIEIAQRSPGDRHHIESFRYLKGVLKEPKKSGLYDWNKLDAFGAALRQITLEEDTIAQLLSVEPKLLDLGGGKSLSLKQGYQLLSVLSKDPVRLEAEMGQADAFLQNMAATMREHFPRVAASRPPHAKTQGARLYQYFLSTPPMTDTALTLDRVAIFQSMDPLLEQLDSLTQDFTAPGQSNANTRAATAPPVVTQNPFLDYFDQTLPAYAAVGGSALPSADWSQALQSLRESVAQLHQNQRDYQLLRQQSDNLAAPRTVAALRQAEQFGTLINTTLLWLYAFRCENTPGDSTIIVYDTIAVSQKRRWGTSDPIAYDSLLRVPHVKTVPRAKYANQWMTRQQFNTVMDDTLKRQAFMGLLYQRLSTMGRGVCDSSANLPLSATKFVQTLYEVDAARANVHHKKTHDQALSFQDYYPFIRATVDMLNTILETPTGANGQSLRHQYDQLKDLPDISNESLSLFENIFAENYGSAIRNVVQLLSITWGLHNQTSKSSPKSRRRDREKIKSAVLTYGSFMANVVEARTADQVKAAIRAVAVPPGSSSVKRHTWFNADLNAYLGLGGYWETLRADNLPSDQKHSTALGLSVPIGLSFSMGQVPMGRKRQAFSLFVPILDLGAVTTYRINQDPPSELPRLSVSNLFAPGAYVLWNIQKSPFSLGAGFQLGPQLRKITLDGQLVNASAWRYGLTFAIDVPVFNLHTQQERGGKRH